MDKMPGLGDMGGMLKQLRQMQTELVKAQKELAKQTLTAVAGNGVVLVTVTGDQRVIELSISPEAAGDAKLAQWVKEALNKALDDSREMAKERLGPLSQGLNF